MNHRLTLASDHQNSKEAKYLRVDRLATRELWTRTAEWMVASVLLLMPRMSHFSSILAPKSAAKIATLGAIVAGAALGCGGGTPASKAPARQAEAEYDMAREVFYRGDWRVSLDHAQRAVALDPQNAKALYFVAVVQSAFCLQDQGLAAPDCKIEEAEAYARRSIDADAKLKDAKNLLGQILILRGRYKEALDVLRPLTQDPSYIASHLAWGNYGWAQVQLGELDAGIKSLQNSVTQPRFCVGYYRLGVAFGQKGDLAAADDNFTRAIEVDSPDCKAMQDAWQGIAEIREKRADLKGALSDFKRCADLAPRSRTGLACSARAASLRARVTPEAS